MSLTETIDFDKDGQVITQSGARSWRAHIRAYMMVLVIILVALLSFGIGRLSGAGNRGLVQIKYDKSLDQSASVISSTTQSKGELAPPNVSAGGVFASSKGKRYYYPWCKSTVSESNKITFNTAQIAESAGYTLATNCKQK
jgi:hypothetical protein